MTLPKSPVRMNARVTLRVTECAPVRKSEKPEPNRPLLRSYLLTLTGEIDQSVYPLLCRSLATIPGDNRPLVIDLMEVTALTPENSEALRQAQKTHGARREVSLLVEENGEIQQALETLPA